MSEPRPEPRGFAPWEHEPDEFDRMSDEDCEDELDDLSCMRMPDGSCGAAGSEWCDFECPYRD